MQNPFSRKNRLQGNILNGDFNGESRWLLQIEHFQHGMAAEKRLWLLRLTIKQGEDSLHFKTTIANY